MGRKRRTSEEKQAIRIKLASQVWAREIRRAGLPKRRRLRGTAQLAANADVTTDEGYGVTIAFGLIRMATATEDEPHSWDSGAEEALLKQQALERVHKRHPRPAYNWNSIKAAVKEAVGDEDSDSELEALIWESLVDIDPPDFTWKDVNRRIGKLLEQKLGTSSEKNANDNQLQAARGEKPTETLDRPPELIEYDDEIMGGEDSGPSRLEDEQQLNHLVALADFDDNARARVLIYIDVPDDHLAARLLGFTNVGAYRTRRSRDIGALRAALEDRDLGM